jgi:DNA-directed RNA polymerase specialized sigma24 family protein
MSKRSDKTTRPGYDAAFHTTHWTEILSARSGKDSKRETALEQLLQRYWKPVYCYLRSKSHDDEVAKDLTQGFFHEIVLGRDLIQRADQAKGRFRTFLLTCLNRYVANVRRDQVAKYRMPKGGFVRLETIHGANIPEPAGYTTPAQIFDYAWASTLMDQVLAELASEFREARKATHWRVFKARILDPIVSNADPPSLADVCAKEGISSKKKASNMVITVKRRFQAILWRHVRQLVSSDAEVYEEIRHLMKIFSRGGAAF